MMVLYLNKVILLEIYEICYYCKLVILMLFLKLRYYAYDQLRSLIRSLFHDLLKS